MNIEDEVRRSFLDYSMSVIISRALPDVRDGLKPYIAASSTPCSRKGLLSSRGYSKSAGVVGEVLKHYHPHGDSAVYDSMVRMAQDFSLRYPLVDGQGNFGSIDGDSARGVPLHRGSPAPSGRGDAARHRPGDGRFRAQLRRRHDGAGGAAVPRLPNLLANGSAGIAVGMATNVPPHNLRELVAALVHEIRNPDCTLDDLLEHHARARLPHRRRDLRNARAFARAYATGRGLLTVRARAEIEDTAKGGPCIIVTEIPFMVNKSSMLERIAELVRDGKIDGVSDLRDESQPRGHAHRHRAPARRPRKRSCSTSSTSRRRCRATFGVNMLALVNGRPQTLSLKQALRHFVDFRREVVVRRATYDLAQAEARAHLLEGFAIALEHLDEVIAIIRGGRGHGDGPDAADGRASSSRSARPTRSSRCGCARSRPWSASASWTSWRRSAPRSPT